ncbi:MAG: hypothetical protein EHM35_02625 [Planctomycetaceae bacterium]|nr:MAG: hypothetical protein EHM35_02625 [Planctomycetaceae bacterium]
MTYHTYYNNVRRAGVPLMGSMASPETGVIAAGLAAGGVIWTYRNPEAATKPLLIQFLRPLTIVVTAFGTPITAGRGLDLVRLTPDAPATADPSGGAAWTPVKVNSISTESVGVGRIATTGALTTTGFTASARMRKHDMSQLGAANNNNVNFWRLVPEEEPMVLRPGEAYALAASQLMDATGTFRLICEMSAVELPD